MKKLLSLLCAVFLVGCTQSQSTEATNTISEEIRTLPDKEKPDSVLAIDSPISATNIDQYLFIDDVLYVDLRDANQLLSEGAIAGFVNIPFYGVLANYSQSENVLFTMSKSNSSDPEAIMGDIGTFSANYEESESILNEIFPKDKPIVFMSTAGVEAAYMMNCLIQFGYDASLLYNAGTFTNGMGDIIAYKDYEQHLYYIEPMTAYSVNTTFSWAELSEK